MKTCSKCGRSLDEARFFKNRRSKDGLRSSCKDCDGELLKKYRATNQQTPGSGDRATEHKLFRDYLARTKGTV